MHPATSGDKPGRPARLILEAPEGNETRTCGGGRPSTAGEGGAISKRRRGRVDKNAAGAWLGAGQKRARKGFGWMREGGGAGAQQPRAGGRGDSLGGATDSVLQPPLQSILQKHTENAVVLIPVVNRQFVILQQE